MKVLITGAAGQLGRALLASAPPQAQVQALSRDELDISDAAAVRASLLALRPGLIINAAAYTAVDKAESEPERAAAVNALGPENLAQAALRVPACRLLHVSTDYVFNGRAERPYRPTDAPDPINQYGRGKLLGEQRVRELLGERAAIVRTAWVYAAHGKNFLLTMLRLMRERGTVRVVADQTGSPTATSSIARVLWRLAERPQLHGVWHWTDDGVTSWYGFACAIAEEAMAHGLLTTQPQVTAIPSAEYPTAAQRPRCSALDTQDTAARLGLQPVFWRTNLKVIIGQLSLC